MENSRKAREQAEAALAGPPEQPTKGSAIGMIAAENRAVQEKSARLKKLRMERDAADAKAALKAEVASDPSRKAKAKPAPKAKRVAKGASKARGTKAPAAA